MCGYAWVCNSGASVNLLMKKNNKAVEASQKQVKRGHTGGFRSAEAKAERS